MVVALLIWSRGVYLFAHDSFSCEMTNNLYMFYSLMKYIITSNEDSKLIVIKFIGLWNKRSNSCKKLLRHNISHVVYVIVLYYTPQLDLKTTLYLSRPNKVAWAHGLEHTCAVIQLVPVAQLKPNNSMKSNMKNLLIPQIN